VLAADDGGMKTALVRRPSPKLADGLVTHIERQPVDVALAEQQWQSYVSALDRCGWRPIEVPAADDCPDSVFVEDAAVMFGRLAVITRPGAPSRRPEIDVMPEVFANLNHELALIEAPGTLDGGDVLKVGSDVYVGLGGRTNADGVRQLRRMLAPRGLSVITVPITKVLHLKSAVTALPDGTVIGFEPLVDDSRIFPRFRAMPEESGAHVVVLDQDRVLMAADCPRSVDLVESLGYEVVTVDIGEFEKLEGCVTCLSVRLRD
jgi:dimethylargininase